MILVLLLVLCIVEGCGVGLLLLVIGCLCRGWFGKSLMLVVVVFVVYFVVVLGWLVLSGDVVVVDFFYLGLWIMVFFVLLLILF